MAVAPDFLPVLSRGKHKNPSKGACFMEYTALLAGERFSDAPVCVDRELAAVLRHANDILGDADRARLIPLLGRAIGLAVPPQAAHDARSLPGATVEAYGRDVMPYARATSALHRCVSSRFMAAVGFVPGRAELLLYDEGRELDPLFWYLMRHPTVVRRSPDYVDRLIERLYLLHECYEQAMVELGLRRTAVAPEPAPVVTHVPEADRVG